MKNTKNSFYKLSCELAESVRKFAIESGYWFRVSRFSFHPEPFTEAALHPASVRYTNFLRELRIVIC